MTEPNKFSDEDIEAALRYMRLHISKEATSEDAKVWLEKQGSDFHKLALADPEKFLELKKKIDKRKQL